LAHYDDYNDKDIFIYLLTCSRRSLGNFLLSQYDENQKLTKDMLLRIEELINHVGKVRGRIYLANLVRDHGEEIISRLPSPQQLPELPQRVLPRMKAAKKA
jgi:hypothetical protein